MGPFDSAAAAAARAPARPTPRARWRGYLAAALACGLTALASFPLLQVLEPTNIAMLFLLAVVAVAWRHGRGPAVLAALLGVALFDLFFVAPQFSFAVSDVQYLVTFGVMLLVGLLIGQLMAGLKAHAEDATRREHRMAGLYAMARDLSAALLPQQVADIGARFIEDELALSSALLVPDGRGSLQPLPGGRAEVDAGLAQWAFDHGAPAGAGAATLPGAAARVLPLTAPMGVRGVLAVTRPEAGSSAPLALAPEASRLLDTCASLLALSLERIHYVEVAQATTLEIESERLRNSVLSAISHDLRTPLAGLVGLADTLELDLSPDAALAARQRTDRAGGIRAAARRMAALVDNLLDMARLQAGGMPLRLAWMPLDEVLGSALAACAAPLAGRPVHLQLPDDLPLLHLDAVLFERVLVNLFENAAKYTPPGSGLVLRALLRPTEVELQLDDHGPGLPAGQEARLFEKFERGHKESATAGVGLGLAICRAIVQAHGGRIGAGNHGRGARLSITLPRGTPPLDDGSAQPLPTPHDQTA